MFLEIYKDTKELGDAEARRIAALLKKKPDALLCLAAGQSAICVYERLIEMYRAGEVDFSKTRIVGLDEWCDYPAYEGSARWILDTTFFNGINLDRSRMRMFNSNPADPEKECREIEKYIDDNGKIDYMILGVGMNGHVALNEPGVDLTLGAHVATLANKTREVSSKYFENGTPVTLTRGLTLGYKNIFEAKDLVVILNGAHKAPIVKKFMETPISNEFPVTNIKRSPIARVVMDQAAASDIYRGVRNGMENFEFYNPCRILFGDGKLDRLGELIRAYSDNILLVYGKSSIRKMGLYDEIVTILNRDGIRFTEISGVEANPKMDLVYQGIAIGREKQIGFILAVGGGSVIDTAKAIAVGIPYSGDVWNVLQRYETATRSLPIGTVLTAVGSGSEMSNSCVITKMPEGLKRSFDSEINIPKFSILDPHYTFSVSPRQTACGSADILSHLMERYFTQVKQADVTDRMLEGLMQTVILYAPRAMEHPEDYDARAELMWAGTLAQNGLLNTGRIGDWACHGIEHEISGEYDIPHGMGLAMITGSWMRYVYSSYPARFTQFARRVFHVDYPDYDEEHIIQEGIYRLEQFFIRLGLPVSTAQLNMSHEVMERLAEQAVYKSPTKGRFRKLTKEDLVKILEMAQGNS